MPKVHISILGRRECNDADYRGIYGEEVIVTRLGRINLIHVDAPSMLEIDQRIEETKREQAALECDCPFCQDLINEPMDIIYLENEEDCKLFMEWYQYMRSLF